MLVQEGVLTLEGLKEGLALQVIRGGQLDTVLLEKNWLPETSLLPLLSRATDYPAVIPSIIRRDLASAASLVELKSAERLGICPLGKESGTVSILVTVATDQVLLEELAFDLNCRLSPFVAPEARVLQVRSLVYGVALPPRFQKLLEQLGDVPLPAVVEFPPRVATIEPRKSLPHVPSAESAPGRRASQEIRPARFDAAPEATVDELSFSASDFPGPRDTLLSVPEGMLPSIDEISTSRRLLDALAVERDVSLALRETMTDIPEMPPLPLDAIEEVLVADEELVPDQGYELTAEAEDSEPTEVSVPRALALDAEAAEALRPPESVAPAALFAAAEVAGAVEVLEALGVGERRDAPSTYAPLEPDTAADLLPEQERPASATVPDGAHPSLAETFAAMHEATDRDALLVALLRGTHGFLECVQVFVVKGNRLQGYLELAGDDVDRTQVRTRRVSLEDASVLSRAAEDGSLFIGPAPETDSSPAALIAAGVHATRAIALLPIQLKGKTICLVVGHSYDRPIPPRLRVPLRELRDEATRALAELIVRRKQKSGPAGESAQPSVDSEPQTLRHAAGAPASTDAAAAAPDLRPSTPETLAPVAASSSGEAGPGSSPAGPTPRPVPPGGFPFDTVHPVDAEEEPPESGYFPLALSSLLEQLDHPGPATREAEAKLVRLGTAGINALIARFPGRLRFDRFAPYTELPPVTECSAVLRALAAMGRPVLLHMAPLFHHRDDDTRFYATYLMSALVFPEGVALLAAQLQDRAPEIRRLAVQILRRFRETEQFPALLLDLRSDLAHPDPRPKRAAAEALAALGDAESVPALTALLGAPDASVAEAGRNALVALTKQDFSLNAKKWTAWWERNRHRHRIEWLIDGLVHKEPETRAAAAADLEEITGLHFGYRFDMTRRERESVRRRFVDWWAETGMFRFGAS
jgi:hypothetical protein